jgi:hypothetical protein
VANLDFAYDLTLDEALYADLDAEQQRIYDELVAAGVLPRVACPAEAATTARVHATVTRTGSTC